MSNVEKFYPANASKNPDAVLEQAIGEYSEVLILGWDKEGNLDIRSTDGLADGGDCLWLIESLKARLMNGDFSD